MPELIPPGMAKILWLLPVIGLMLIATAILFSLKPPTTAKRHKTEKINGMNLGNVETWQDKKGVWHTESTQEEDEESEEDEYEDD